MTPSKATHLAFIVLALVGLAILACCSLAPPMLAPEPTATTTSTPTATPIPVVIVVTPAPTATTTPTPRFVALPSTGALTDQIAEKYGFGFTYIQYHFVPADSEVWVCYGWPEKDENVYRAVFRLVGSEWKLVETKPMETPEPTLGPVREVMR